MSPQIGLPHVPDDTPSMEDQFGEDMTHDVQAEELIPEDIRNQAITLFNEIVHEDDPSIPLARALMAARISPPIGGRGEVVAAEREAIAEYLRYCAGHYPESSDGRNTFVMAASWVEARTHPAPAPGPAETLAFPQGVSKETQDALDAIDANIRNAAINAKNILVGGPAEAEAGLRQCTHYPSHKCRCDEPLCMHPKDAAIYHGDIDGDAE